MVHLRGWLPQSFVIIYSLVGCTGVTPFPSELSSPLFPATTEDTARLSRLTRELDNRALNCLDGATCEQVHFSRALVSLFENQEAARASFRRVIKDNPSSALAASSRLWLQLIAEEGIKATSAHEPQHPVVTLMAGLVRDWMIRELTGPTKDSHPAEPTTVRKAMVEPSEIVQVLQKQVRERDRHIATLQSKLEALRMIDQDHENRKRNIKLPSTRP